MYRRSIAFVLVCLLFCSVFSAGASAQGGLWESGADAADAVTELIHNLVYGKKSVAEPEAELPPLPVLVNGENPLPRDYQPELVALGKTGYRATPDTAAAFVAMVEAAKADGVTLVICSAYRSYDTQTALYQRKVAAYKPRYGASAYDKAATVVARPGTSEHQLGEAIDFGYQLTSAFAQTKAGRWLAENAADYGFILRYPKDSIDITGVIYEPWHYRYVGVEHAARIVESGLVLEEYIAREMSKVTA